MALPSFSSMWTNYPFPGGSSSAAKAKIGGNVNMGWITNTCVIRLSYCFNKSGHPIPNGYPGLNTARGGDGKRYAYRVREFKTFLERKYKYADASGDRSAVDGKRGIIMFDVAGWSDATGHFDLWNGSSCRHKAYFENASVVHLWEC